MMIPRFKVEITVQLIWTPRPSQKLQRNPSRQRKLQDRGADREITNTMIKRGENVSDTEILGINIEVKKPKESLTELDPIPDPKIKVDRVQGNDDDIGTPATSEEKNPNVKKRKFFFLFDFSCAPIDVPHPQRAQPPLFQLV